MRRTNLNVAIYNAILNFKKVMSLLPNDSDSEDDRLDLFAELAGGAQFRIIVDISCDRTNTVRNGNDTLCRHTVNCRIAVIPLSDIDKLYDDVDEIIFFECQFDYTYDVIEKIEEFVKSNIIDRMEYECLRDDFISYFNRLDNCQTQVDGSLSSQNVILKTNNECAILTLSGFHMENNARFVDAKLTPCVENDERTLVGDKSHEWIHHSVSEDSEIEVFCEDVLAQWQKLLQESEKPVACIG